MLFIIITYIQSEPRLKVSLFTKLVEWPMSEIYNEISFILSSFHFNAHSNQTTFLAIKGRQVHLYVRGLGIIKKQVKKIIYLFQGFAPYQVPLI